MSDSPRAPRWHGGARLLAAGALAAWLAGAGCATLPAAHVAEQPDGSLRVEVEEEQSFKALALSVYDDAKLGEAVAQVAGLPYAAGVPAGTVLTLPSRRSLEERLDIDRKTEKLFRKGKEATRAGEWDTAVTRYRQALELRPDRVDVRQSLGVALLQTGDVEESYRLLDDAADQHPYDADTRHALGTVLRKRGALEAALSEFEAAVGIDEAHARAAYDRARTLQDLERYEEARRAFQTFLYAFPTDPWADDARRFLEELSQP